MLVIVGFNKLSRHIKQLILQLLLQPLNLIRRLQGCLH